MKTADTPTTTTTHRETPAQTGPFFREESGPEAFFSAASDWPAERQPFFSGFPIQPKLTVGQPGDRYEQEADHTADQVVQRLAQSESYGASVSEAPALTPVAPAITPVQRKCASCEAELDEGREEGSSEAPLQRKPAFAGGDTPLEEEATVQRKCAACAAQERLQAQSEQAPTPSADLESRLSATKGGGVPLPAETRSHLEGAMGADFSGVRVHTDSSAVQMNQELGAQAFTHGSNVYFNAGNYDTGSRSGQHLLAHELTHVVQQAGGDIRPKTTSGHQQFSSSENRVQRRTLDEVGAVEEGSSLRFEDGEWVAPGRAGYSQLLVGASGEMAQGLLESGSLDGVMLTPITPNLSGMGRQAARWAARARQAEERKSFLNPPSIEEFHEQARASAEGQVGRISQARQQLLSKVHDYNAFTAKANTFVASAARLSSMQAIIGATDNQSLANALVAGLQEATQVASAHQEAYRLPGSGVAEQLRLPSQDNTVDNSLQAVNSAGSELRNSYNNFRVNMMQDFIRRLTAAGQQDRDRRDEINRNKEVIANIGTAIDVAMPYIAPSSSMMDVAVAQGRAALPTPGGALTLIGDLAYQREVEGIERRLARLDTVISAENATIDAELYRNRKEDFVRKLRAMKDARDQLNDRMISRRESYRNLGEQLDRFARSSAGGNRVRRGQEHFTTILTVTAQVRELLSVGSWAASGSPSEQEIRAWVSSMFDDHTSPMYRFSRITEGEAQAIRGMYGGIRQFATQWQQTDQVFGPVGAAAGAMLGTGPLRPEGSGEY